MCSVIGMVAAEDEKTDMLDFCLKGTMNNLESWGTEYLRAMAGQIGKQYEDRIAKGESTDDLLKLVDVIVP